MELSKSIKYYKIKWPMKGRRFATIEEIKTESLRQLKVIPKSAYQKCFEDWKKRWHKCIISEGDYFEGDNIEIHEKINIFWKKWKFTLFFEQASYVCLLHVVLYYVVVISHRSGRPRNEQGDTMKKQERI